MIKLIRVDHRLLHGQVAVSWFNSLGANTILIANDDVANDDLRKTAMRLAKPTNAKLVMKCIDYSINAINEGLTNKYELFIVVETIEDAYKLIKNTEGITALNLGGIKSDANKKNLTAAVNVSPEEISMLNELVQSGVEVEIRQIPGDKKILYKDII